MAILIPLLIYLFGGLTLLPGLALLLFSFIYLTSPTISTADTPSEPLSDNLRRPGDTGDAVKSGKDVVPEQFRSRAHEGDVAAGYFAVCREYVPGGVNGKPPERTTPAGAVVATESPSVYQSMYRSIFDRNKTQAPSMDGGRPNGKLTKKARNVFYVVLRHGHLMLYDDAEQLEVRHVISLEHHYVDIYGGGDIISEGELFIKRNCIRLKRKSTTGDLMTKSKPFFFFSDNCSDKEDFYHVMLQNQERKPGAANNPPRPLGFETPDIIKLVRQLHTSEENLQTRWLNAVIGRLFLSLYKTSDIEDFVRMKFTRKISRVSKPAFLTTIKLQRVDMGHSAPIITNPKLKELTIEGDLTVEADVFYDGNFRLEIAAVARIELGSKFKPREVNLILAGYLKKLEGHIFMRIKPPPSNRVWLTFETMPKIEMSIEPVVSSRQITYGVILRAIESRIREVMADSIVFPNWDDVPFTNSVLQRFRGGIWEDANRASENPESRATAAENGLVVQGDKDSESEEEALQPSRLGSREKMMSTPSLPERSPSPFKLRKAASSTNTLEESATTGFSVTPQSRSQTEGPKSMRSNSFASAAPALVSTDPATAISGKDQVKEGQQDAASAVRDISARSQPTSPVDSPVGSPSQTIFSAQAKKESFSSTSTESLRDDVLPEGETRKSIFNELRRESEPADFNSAATDSGKSSFESKAARSLHAARSLATAEKRASINQSIGSATAAAKKWGWGVLNRRPDQFATGRMSSDRLDVPGSPSQPMGRGQPLPPPGTPLPFPERPGGWTSPLNIAKRKPVASSAAKAAALAAVSSSKPPRPRTPSPKAPPLPARHKPSVNGSDNSHVEDEFEGDELLVVEAPAESQPASPAVERDSPPSFGDEDPEDRQTPPTDLNMGLNENENIVADGRMPLAKFDNGVYWNKPTDAGERDSEPTRPDPGTDFNSLRFPEGGTGT